MKWYTVTKSIKGRPYLYRQRTYRQGGKVRTESQYIGPIVDEAAIASGIDVVSLDEEQPQPVAIKRNLSPQPASLRIQKQVRHRSDLSEPALWAEEDHACQLMGDQGLDTRGLRPVRLWAGKTVRVERKKDGYYVYGPLSGRRTSYKRAFRAAMGLRWLDEFETQYPHRYDALRFFVSSEMKWLSGVLATQSPWYAFLINWFTGREPWKQEAADVVGEMIQHGPRKIYEKSYKEAFKASKVAQRELRKFKSLKRPKSRKRQYAKYKRARDKANRLSARFGLVSWTRLYVFGEDANGTKVLSEQIR